MLHLSIFVFVGEMKIYLNEHEWKFTEGKGWIFFRPQLIWSVLGWWSFHVEEVTKEDVAPEAVAGLRQC